MRADLLGRLLGGIRQVVEYDAGARSGQGDGLGAAEPGTGTGDDGDAAFEVSVGSGFSGMV